MNKKIALLSLFATLSLFADGELDSLKKQLKTLQAQVNTIKKQNAQKAQDELDAKMASSSTSSSFSQSAYLPDIALVLNMSAQSRDVPNSQYQNFAIPGFIDSGDAELPFNKDRGFNLNYAELALHSAVDPYFEAFAILHLHPNQLEIGEAYVVTRSMPDGLRIKAGKFKSNFGRINEKHQHSWNFSAQPIIYKALLGPDGISDAGVQLQWVAPTDTYIMAGVEAMQGTNDRSFGESDGANLYVGYLKSSVDFGDDLSVLGGVSIAHGKNTQMKDTDIFGVDLTFRQQLGSYSSIIWQSEYLQRDKVNNSSNTDKQEGLYSELIYNYNKNYASGIRYDKITKNSTDLSSYNGIDTDNLDKYTAMIQYKPFPMSRLRLQYSFDRTKIIDGQRKNINEIMLELNIAAGAHGAHSY
jgi:hypothetical protein